MELEVKKDSLGACVLKSLDYVESVRQHETMSNFECPAIRLESIDGSDRFV